MKTGTRTLLAAMAVTVIGSGAAAWAAEETAGERDIRCLGVGLAMVEEGDAKTKQAGMMSMLYFGGRVEARDPKANAMDVAWKAYGKMSPDQLTEGAKLCGQIMVDKGRAWEERRKALEGGKK